MRSLVCLALLLHGATASGQLQRPGGAAEAEEVFAGYRALFTCSAHFVAGRPLADILRVELIDTVAAELPDPTIDSQRQIVQARDHAGRTAVAAYRDTMGCTLLPPDWQAGDAARLPYVAFPKRAERQGTFPNGDQASPNPNRRQRELLNQAFDGDTFGTGSVTIGVAVIKDGELIAEQYREGFGIHSGYRTWSTAKSITASLIGIAAGEGLIDLDQPANIPEWRYLDDPRQVITPRDLLWMSSGLASYGSNTNAIYFAGQDVISAATSMPLEAPTNSRWKYANNDTLLLLRALRATLDDDVRYLRYPYDELLHRIGMFDTRMEVDHQGNFIGSSQVYTTVRDLARFGLLYLNDGVWNGERILPEGWAAFVAQDAPAKPREANERGYGAQFWLLDSIDGIPKGTYTTAGNKGQYVTVIPETNTVVVRMGVDPNGIRWRQEDFVKAVLNRF